RTERRPGVGRGRCRGAAGHEREHAVLEDERARAPPEEHGDRRELSLKIADDRGGGACEPPHAAYLQSSSTLWRPTRAISARTAARATSLTAPSAHPSTSASRRPRALRIWSQAAAGVSTRWLTASSPISDAPVRVATYHARRVPSGCHAKSRRLAELQGETS